MRNRNKSSPTAAARLESWEILNAFMNAAAVSFSIFDSHLNLIEMNEVGLAWQWPRVKKEELIGKNLAELAPHLKESGRIRIYEKIIETGEPYFADDVYPGAEFGDIHFEIKAFKVADGLGIITSNVTERKQAEQKLEQLARNLGERVKELNCLYGISSLVERHDELEDILQGTVELIPRAWQYPGITCTRITLHNREYKTANFKPTPWKQSGDILVKGKKAGILEVCYLEEKPDEAEGPFLREESKLLRAVCERLGRIIERKQAEEQLKASLAEKEVLLKEVHHRVKNNLQMIDSLLSLQVRRLQDGPGAAVLQEVKNRISSIALVHEKIYGSSDLSNINLGEYIDTLTTYLMQSSHLPAGAVNLKTEITNLSLTLDKAIPCALLINELVTNSLKYAFPAGRKGEIEVGCSSGPDGEAILYVADDGVGLPEDFHIESASTLGIQIVKALCKQLHCTLHIDQNREKGVKFTIRFQAGDRVDSGRQ